VENPQLPKLNKDLMFLKKPLNGGFWFYICTLAVNCKYADFIFADHRGINLSRSLKNGDSINTVINQPTTTERAINIVA
jgi:ssDNA-binding Zn-finger/Zn-ribbon topoisomerase 1